PNVITVSIVTPPANLFEPATGVYQNPTNSGAEWERPASIEFLVPANGGGAGAPGAGARTPVVAGQGFQVDAGLRMQGGRSRVPSNQARHAFRLVFKRTYGAGKLSFPVFGDGTGPLDTLVLRSGYNNSWTHRDPAQRDRADHARDAWARLSQRDLG